MIQRRPYRSFLSYIDLSREYYAAHGYITAEHKPAIREYYPPAKEPLRIPHSLAEVVIRHVNNTFFF